MYKSLLTSKRNACVSETRMIHTTVTFDRHTRRRFSLTHIEVGHYFRSNTGESVSKASRQELERQMAAFLSSGGQVTQVQQVDSPKMCEARYYNATDRIVARKIGRRSQITSAKKHLMNSTRGGTLV